MHTRIHTQLAAHEIDFFSAVNKIQIRFEWRVEVMVTSHRLYNEHAVEKKHVSEVLQINIFWKGDLLV